MPAPIFSGYPTPPDAPEPLEYGNINVLARRAVKVVEKPKGTFKLDPSAKEGTYEWATLLSVTIGPRQVDAHGQKCMILVPTVSDDGTRILTRAEAEQQYVKDGRHLGIFTTQRNITRTATETTIPAVRKYLADVYAEKLSELERKRLAIDRERLATEEARDSSRYEFRGVSTSDVGFVTSIFSLVGVDEETKRSINERMSTLSVSYSMNQSTELSAVFLDDGYSLSSAGFFDLRRVFSYRGRNFEVSGVQTGPGSGGSPQVDVQFQPQVVQELRRDKKPESIGGTSGYEYARRVALSKGLAFVGEKSNKQQAVFKSSGSTTDESVWSVLGRSSGDTQVSFFEVDGVLVWGSMTWMLWKFGLTSRASPKDSKVTQKYLELRYDPNQENNGARAQQRVLKRQFAYGDLDVTTGLLFAPIDDPTQPTGIPSVDEQYETIPDNGVFELTTWPRVRMSENDGLEGEGSCDVMSPNGKLIRPGHTVFLSSVPDHFRGGYLVSDVSFEEFGSEPVTVSFVTPQKPKNQQKPEE